MKIIKSLHLFYIVLFLLISVSLESCSSRSKRKQNSDHQKIQQEKLEDIQDSVEVKKPKISFFLENSGSMFGYFKESPDLISVVSHLAADCSLSAEEVNYYFINGKCTNLGIQHHDFINKLTIKGINCGDVKQSDLNHILSTVMDEVGTGRIGVLISDGIYSVQNTNVLGELMKHSNTTYIEFAKRLQKENIMTTVYQFNAPFNGRYFPAKGSAIRINQLRPYYIWVFGHPKDVANCFDLNYFGEELGAINEAKFISTTSSQLNYKYIPYKKKGKFKSRNEFEYYDVKRDRNEAFSFSLALDLSAYPFPEEYFLQSDNYTIDLAYQIQEIGLINDLESRDRSGIKKDYTHYINLKKEGAPWGELNIAIKNKPPVWIKQTNDEDDSDILGDVDHTFGFEYLMNGISRAYEKVNGSDEIGNITIKIKQ